MGWCSSSTVRLTFLLIWIVRVRYTHYDAHVLINRVHGCRMRSSLSSKPAVSHSVWTKHSCLTLALSLRRAPEKSSRPFSTFHLSRAHTRRHSFWAVIDVCANCQTTCMHAVVAVTQKDSLVRGMTLVCAIERWKSSAVASVHSTDTERCKQRRWRAKPMCLKNKILGGTNYLTAYMFVRLYRVILLLHTDVESRPKRKKLKLEEWLSAGSKRTS